MTLKLVDMTDRRGWFEKIQIPAHRWKREQMIARMAISARDAIEALDLDEYEEVIERMDLSQQEIDEMCRVLERNTRRMEYINNQAIKYLRKLKPKRIWMTKKVELTRDEL